MISKHYFLTLLFPLILGCVNNETSTQIKNPETGKASSSIDTVYIIHDVLPVRVPVSGTLEYWKKSIIKTYDSSQVIAVMADEKQNVSAQDLLFSLWSLKEPNEFTPEDIRAPFPGTIGNVYVRVGEKLGANAELAEISNSAYLLMNTVLPENKIKLLNKGMIVTSQHNNHFLKGYIKEINYSLKSIKVLFENSENLSEEFGSVKAFIECGKVKGEFIHKKLFKGSRVEVMIDDESNFYIYPVAVADSLVMVSPPLPHLTKVLIKTRL